jgi:hypothetical protein
VTDSTSVAAPEPELTSDVDTEIDPVCAGAVELARVAAQMVGGSDVGEHMGCVAVAEGAEANEGGCVVDHYFACRHPGYRGWRWCVTVARPFTDRVVSVDEVALLPAADAVLAPAWLPWSERLRPDDLGPGDLLPTPPDDPRLVPSFASAEPDALDDDVTADAARYEHGIGRPRVLSRAGRDDAADRWYAGDAGPEAPMARQAPGACGTCGFYLPLAGSLGRAFGVCGNGLVPDDGRAVAADHGCGGHSEAVELPPLPQADAPPPLVDDDRYEYEVLPT